MQLPSGAVSLRFRKHSLARRLVAAVGDLSGALGRLVGVLLVLADDLDTTLLVGDNADRLRRNYCQSMYSSIDQSIIVAASFSFWEFGASITAGKCVPCR